MPPGFFNEDQFYEEMGNYDVIKRQQDNTRRGETLFTLPKS